MSVFETETMAELCVKQGLVTEALAIYRRLVADAPDDLTRARRAARLEELQRTAAGAARAKAGPSPAPVPAEGAPSLALDRRGDSLTFSWVLPDDTRGPALQLFFVRRGEDGVVTETRTVPVDAPRGALTLTVLQLHSVRAAAGRLEDERFVPLARLSA
jgi:hypothetical protein